MTARQITHDTSLDRLARWLSRVFHPFILSALTLFLTTYLDTQSFAMAVRWTFICAVVFLVPLFFYILAMVRRGRYSDTDVSIREQRHGLYLICGLCLLLMVAVFVLGSAPPISQVGLYAAVSATVISALINRFSKISVHAMMAAGGATMLFYLSLPIGIALGAAAACVSWSRVRLGRHTWRQVITGWTVAILCVVAVFYFYL